MSRIIPILLSVFGQCPALPPRERPGGAPSGMTNGVPSGVPSEVPGEAQARLGAWRQADAFGRPVGMAAAAFAETVDVTGAETGLAATPLRAPGYCRLQ